MEFQALKEFASIAATRSILEYLTPAQQQITEQLLPGEESKQESKEQQKCADIFPTRTEPSSSPAVSSGTFRSSFSISRILGLPETDLEKKDISVQAINDVVTCSKMDENHCSREQQPLTSPTDFHKFLTIHKLRYSTSESVESARLRLSADNIDALERVFAVNPYPQREMKNKLCRSLNLTRHQVTNWFQNRRSKAKRQRNHNLYGLREVPCSRQAAHSEFPPSIIANVPCYSPVKLDR